MATNGIPGLDVIEEDPRTGPRPIRSPQGLAAQESLRANMGPTPQPGNAAGVAPPNTGLRGAEDRLNRWASAINENSAAQRAGIGTATQGLREGAQAVGRVGTAVGNVASAVVNNPLVRAGGAVAGGLSALSGGADTYDALKAGDVGTAAIRGTDTLGAAASILPRAAGSLGLAYGVGHLAGTGAYHGLNQFESGRGVLDTIGGGVNRFANYFGAGIDPALRARFDMPSSALRANPYEPPAAKAAPAVQTAPAQSAQPALTPNDLRLASGAAQSPALPAQPPVGSIQRAGNTYSGTDVPFGADIRNANGSLRTGGTVSSLDTSEGYKQDLMELGRLRAERVEREAAYPGNQPGGGLVDMSSRALGFRQVGDASSPLMSDKERMNNANNATSRAIAEGNQRVSLRNQTLDHAAAMSRDATAQQGHYLTAQTNNARLRSEQFEKDRTYGQTLRQFDAGRQDAAFTQKQARESQLQKNIESIVPAGPDGKPDMQAAAQLRQHFDRAAGRSGVALDKMSPRQEQELIAASSLLNTMKQNAGILPWKPDALKTIDALDLTGLRMLPSGDRQIMRKGQAFGQIIPGRFFKTEEGARFFGGTPTNRYDILSEEGR